MTQKCTSIGRSNIQSVFVEVEDVTGVLQKPTASGFIKPAGDTSISQTPTYSESPEKSDDLDLLKLYQDSPEPGDISIPMMVALKSDYSAPQGDALFEALMGSVQAPDAVTAALAAAIDDGDTEIDVDTVAGGFLTPRGVILIDSEKIRYTGKEESSTVAGQYTLKGCKRGYAGTTAASHLDDAAVTLKSRAYLFEDCRPSVSVWVRFDHAVMFMSGCVVTQATLPMEKQGGQTVEFTLQGRRLGWCGNSTVASVTDGVVTLGDGESFGYREGAYIKNVTKDDDNSGAGYKISSIDNDANTITVSPAPTGWAKDDELSPWLPDATGIPSDVEARYTQFFIDGQRTTRTTGSISIGTPTEFVTTEIGDFYPGENADTKRDISISGGAMLRKKDVKNIGKGYKGFESPVDVTFGNGAGNVIAFHFPRVKFNMPTVSADGAFLSYNQDLKALGSGDRKGGSSLYITLE